MTMAGRPGARLTKLDVNLGFTGGNNAVLRPAMQSADPPQYFLLLNSDTIVRPNAFKALVDFMDQIPRSALPAADWKSRTARHSDPPSAFNRRSANSKEI